MKTGTVVCLALTMLVALPALAVQRMVLVENFANVSCGGCNSIKDTMDVIFDEYAGQVVPIRVHTWWPNDDDPFYVYNAWECSLRVAYYGGIAPWIEYYYVPSFRFDGEYIKDPSDDDFATLGEWYGWVRNTLDSLATIPSPLRIDITRNEFSPDSDSVYVDFDVVAENSADFNMNLHLVVTEWRHRYDIYGKHDDVFRDFVPDENGYSLSPMMLGDSLHFEWAYVVDPEYLHASCGCYDRVTTNIFIQKSGTREVQQAATGLPTAYCSGVDVTDIPEPVRLGKNSPNPFTAQTTISYEVERGGSIRLSVYAPTGRLVADLVDGHIEPGSYTVTWDGRDRFGREVGSGVYYYSLRIDRISQAGKMIFLR